MNNTMKGMFGSLMIAGMLFLMTGFNSVKAQTFTLHNFTNCQVAFEAYASTTCVTTCTAANAIGVGGTITIPAPCIWTPGHHWLGVTFHTFPGTGVSWNSIGAACGFNDVISYCGQVPINTFWASDSEIYLY